MAAERKGQADDSVLAGVHSMPGVIPRTETFANKGAGGLKVAADVQAEAITSGTSGEIKMDDRANGTMHTNGMNGLANGTYVNGLSTTPTESQRKTSTAIENLVGQLPPEIEHITFGYVPFSSLVSRLVQETFNGLTDIINDMSDMPIPQPSQNGPLNHLSHHVNGTGASADTNVKKKLRILNFASDRRAQFIKILILSKWARQADAVSKVIDLNVWARNRIIEYQDCISWMGELKRRLGPLRDPNPDIKTALEVLSLGKASSLPDLGYLPPKPLSAQQLLSTLRKINILLSIRLNLHESIPPAFRNFSIASGRVTFRVPEEFEVDLSIAEEDPSSQLYFIDFRYIFSPTPKELQAGALRNEVEGRANHVLKGEGLRGLFDFLHNLVLTHKLAVLNSQAYEMARGYWSENLKVEAVHRSIVVQYWLNRPGPKNWIEVGLKRGKEANNPYSLNEMRIPHIAIRWFRGGKEVDDVQMMMRLDELSLADILKKIIALHTNYIFQNIASKLGEAASYSRGHLRLKRNSAMAEPMDACLLVQLTSSKAVKMVQEPVSGRFAVMPASLLNSKAEIELNRLVFPANEGASQFVHLRSFAALEEVDMSARSIGWEPVRSLNPNQETLQRLFSKGIQRTRFFRRPKWSASWLLAFTTSLEGDFWWVVELSDKETAAGPGSGNTTAGLSLQRAYKIISAGHMSHTVNPPAAALAQIERTAAGMISQNIDARHLSASRIAYRIQLSPPNSARSQSPSASIFIRFPTRKAASLIRSPDKVDLPWAHEIVKLEYRGLNASNTSAVHIASVRISKSISNVRDVISAIPSIAFQPATECLAFQILTKVGETTIPNLTRRLSAIGLLFDFVSTIKLHKIKFHTVSLTHINFTYAATPSLLKATIHFAADTLMHVSLTPPNPHLRIINHLTALLRSRDLTAVIATMRMTLPFLNTLSTIEASGGVEVLTRTEQWYQIRYLDPYAKGGYDIQLRQRRDDAMWFVSEASVKKPEAAGDAFEEGLKAVMIGKGDGWWGVNGGMIAHLDGVGNLIARLDEVFRMTSTKHVIGESNPRKRKAEEEIVEID